VIRNRIKDDYSEASDKGISKKLLKTDERKLERKINGLHDVLEPDEQSKLEMLTEKLGDFANTPPGGAAMAKASGAAAVS
jgi:hypothetical protein